MARLVCGAVLGRWTCRTAAGKGSRSRRNLLKVAGVVAGAVIATPVMLAKEAEAQWWCWWCCGNVCFRRGTPIGTPDGYRAVGALGDNAPTADICLTASHAVFVDGGLVPVINLVNGTSIVFETAEGAVRILARSRARRACVPLLSFYGGRDQLRSRLRSAASIVLDRRQPLDVIRDQLEERGLPLAKAA